MSGSKSHDLATVPTCPFGNIVGLRVLIVPRCSEFVGHDLILFGYRSRNELIFLLALIDPLPVYSTTRVRVGINKKCEAGSLLSREEHSRSVRYTAPHIVQRLTRQAPQPGAR